MVEKLREVLVEPRRGTGGIVPVGMPLRFEWLEGILVDGNEESGVWRLILLVVLVVPLLEGRYERTDVIFSVYEDMEGSKDEFSDSHVLFKGVPNQLPDGRQPLEVELRFKQYTYKETP